MQYIEQMGVHLFVLNDNFDEQFIANLDSIDNQNDILNFNNIYTFSCGSEYGIPNTFGKILAGITRNRIRIPAGKISMIGLVKDKDIIAEYNLQVQEDQNNARS